MNYNITTCCICQHLMTFRQLREAVYWLPDMTYMEAAWARYEGYVFHFAHRSCWKGLKEKRRRAIRLYSYRGHEPRSMDQEV